MNKKQSTIFALVVACVTSLSHAQAIQGNAQAGEGKVAMCIGCHGIAGYQSSFPEVHRVPMISGQNAKYIASALEAYKKGDRRHPTMRGVAEALSEQDIADVSAYYEQHVRRTVDLPAQPRREPSAQVADLLKRGACVSCHGDNFSKPIDPSYPNLAGQHADYLFVALKAYKGQQNTQVVGRTNPVMVGIATQFSNAELKALAQYISRLDSNLQTVPQSRWR